MGFFGAFKNAFTGGGGNKDQQHFGGSPPPQPQQQQQMSQPQPMVRNQPIGGSMSQPQNNNNNGGMVNAYSRMHSVPQQNRNDDGGGNNNQPSVGRAPAPQQRMSPQQGPQLNQGIGPRMGGMNRGMGQQQQNQGYDPYYNASLPGTRAGMNHDTGGPSFGDDPSGRINRLNPTGSPDFGYVQSGRTGGYLAGTGVTIGEGRSITPQQYQAQIAQAQAAGVPQQWIQSFLQQNPGDSNRLLEMYASEEGGKYKNQMQNAQQTPWNQFAGQPTGMPDYNPMGGGGLGPSGGMVDDTPPYMRQPQVRQP